MWCPTKLDFLFNYLSVIYYDFLNFAPSKISLAFDHPFTKHVRYIITTDVNAYFLRSWLLFSFIRKEHHIRLPYQPPVSNTFLSEQISNQSAILFSQNQSTSATNQTTLVSFSSQTFAQLLVTSIVLKCFPNYRHINLHLLIRSIKYELMTKHIP
jgi:hypothetical protein